MYKIAMVLALLSTPAWADDIMVVKAGEWIRTMSMDGDAPGEPLKTCASTDRVMTDAVLQKMMTSLAGCTFSHSRSGSTVTINSACAMGAMKINTVAIINVLSEDDYSMTSKSHIDNPPHGMAPDMAMDMHWRRTGPCQPGDRTMPSQ